jgi:putative ABC transport system substrate-binding protein
MQRRQFMTLLGGSAAAWPLVALAQVASKQPVVAVLSGVARKVNSPLVAFERGMQELGYVDGQNIHIDYRYADGKFDRLAELAGELIRLSPNVIVAAITPAAVAARALTQTIPIVCPLLANPIGFGLIASESRPRGNVTGVLFRTDGLAGKQVELALQLIPRLAKLGFLVNVASGVIIDRQELEKTCQMLGIGSVPAEVRTPDDLDMAKGRTRRLRLRLNRTVSGAEVRYWHFSDMARFTLTFYQWSGMAS